MIYEAPCIMAVSVIIEICAFVCKMKELFDVAGLDLSYLIVQTDLVTIRRTVCFIGSPQNH